MKNFIQPGHSLPVTLPYDVSGGDGCLVGTIFGVAVIDGLSGAEADLNTSGVFELTALNTSTASQGAAAYWDDTNKHVTNAASGNTLIGKFAAAKTSGPVVATVWVHP